MNGLRGVDLNEDTGKIEVCVSTETTSDLNAIFEVVKYDERKNMIEVHVRPNAFRLH